MSEREAARADAALLGFLRDADAHVPTEDGKIVELDLSAIGPALGDYQNQLVEQLRHVEIASIANTTLRTLDLSGWTHLRELRLGASRREIQINVSECRELTTITLLPYSPDAPDVYETLVVCRLEQISRAAAQAMETRGRTAGGLLTVRLEFVDGEELSGAKRVRPVWGEMLSWLSRHSTTDLATILASYWHECPWFWAQYDDESQLTGDQRATFRRLRDIEARVAAGFYVSEKHPFDIRDDAWKHISRDRDLAIPVKREIPPWMFAAASR
jgi:hypothetical protein